jgi:hypothetical protein
MKSSGLISRHRKRPRRSSDYSSKSKRTTRSRKSGYEIGSAVTGWYPEQRRRRYAGKLFKIWGRCDFPPKDCLLTMSLSVRSLSILNWTRSTDWKPLLCTRQSYEIFPSRSSFLLSIPHTSSLSSFRVSVVNAYDDHDLRLFEQIDIGKYFLLGRYTYCKRQKREIDLMDLMNRETRGPPPSDDELKKIT